MNTKQRKQLRLILNSVRHARKHIDPMLPLQYLQILLEVSLDSGLSHKEMYERLAPQSASSTARGLKDLSKISWKYDNNNRRREGHGLLRSDPDPMELRVKRITLTQEGADYLADMLGGTV